MVRGSDALGGMLQRKDTQLDSVNPTYSVDLGTIVGRRRARSRRKVPTIGAEISLLDFYFPTPRVTVSGNFTTIQDANEGRWADMTDQPLWVEWDRKRGEYPEQYGWSLGPDRSLTLDVRPDHVQTNGRIEDLAEIFRRSEQYHGSSTRVPVLSLIAAEGLLTVEYFPHAQTNQALRNLSGLMVSTYHLASTEG